MWAQKHDPLMKGKRCSEEQIVGILGDEEGGWSITKTERQYRVSFGAGVANTSRQTALCELAHGKLSDRVIERVERFASGVMRLEAGVEEVRLEGMIIVPHEDLTTEIDGQRCSVAFGAREKPSSPEAHCVPVLLKEHLLTDLRRSCHF